MSKQLIISELQSTIKTDEDRIIEFTDEILTTTDTNKILFFNKIIILYKLQITLCKAILKNNRNLYDLLNDKMQENMIDLLEFISANCETEIYTEQFYIEISKSLMIKNKLLKALILFVNTMDLSV